MPNPPLTSNGEHKKCKQSIQTEDLDEQGGYSDENGDGKKYDVYGDLSELDEFDNGEEKSSDEKISDHQIHALNEESESDWNKIENDNEDIEVDPPVGHCAAELMKGFSKDIGSLFAKTNNLERELKEKKRLLQERPRHQCNIRSLSSQLKEKSSFYLVPKLPLMKRSHVRKMQADIEDNEEYKIQFVSFCFHSWIVLWNLILGYISPS